MYIEINNETSRDLAYLDPIYKNLLEKTLEKVNFSTNCSVSVTFVDVDFIHKLNKEYRSIDRPTDIISFAYLDDINEKNIKSDYQIDLGEMYICVDVAEQNAIEFKSNLKKELCFLFIHGVLHLLGYDHMTSAEEKEMFSLQEEILSSLNINR